MEKAEGAEVTDIKDVPHDVDKYAAAEQRKIEPMVNQAAYEIQAAAQDPERTTDIKAWWIKPKEWIAKWGAISDLAPIALHIGAGPSLDNHFTEDGMKTFMRLAGSRRCSVFACDAICHRLEMLDLKPNYVVTAEETGHCKFFFQGLHIDFFKGPTLLATTMIHPQTFVAWRGQEIKFWHNWTERERERWLKLGGIPGDAPLIEPPVTNVLFHSVEIARLMGYRKHVLMGCDLEVTDTKPTHAEGVINLGIAFVQHKRRFEFNLKQVAEAIERKDARLDGIVNCSESGALVLNNITLERYVEREGLK